MRKSRWFQYAAALAIVAGAPSVFAADHLDGPLVMKDPATDITDVYAWTETDKVLLVLNVAPLATKDSKFSDAVQYVLHVESTKAYGEPGQKTNVICTFDASQMISCWVGDQDYVHGDASPSDGIKSASGKVRVFAGLRADPFFFNLEGFKDAVATVDAAEKALMFDKSGCPTVDGPTSMALVGMLQGTMKGTMPAKNFFETANVLSIVMEVDKTLLTSGGPILAIWGSTNKAGG
jgi:hypothetical protein